MLPLSIIQILYIFFLLYKSKRKIKKWIPGKKKKEKKVLCALDVFFFFGKLLQVPKYTCVQMCKCILFARWMNRNNDKKEYTTNLKRTYYIWRDKYEGVLCTRYTETPEATASTKYHTQPTHTSNNTLDTDKHDTSSTLYINVQFLKNPAYKRKKVLMMRQFFHFLQIDFLFLVYKCGASL